MKKRWFECAALGCLKRKYMRGPFTDDGQTWLCVAHFRRSLPLCKKRICQAPALFRDRLCLYHHALRVGTVTSVSHELHSLPCSIQPCENKIICAGFRRVTHREDRICGFHRNRKNQGFSGPLNSPKKENIKGPNNPRWNGGVSEYPNHSFFKKQRLRKLLMVGYKCEMCKKGCRLSAHHKNRDKSDHRLVNLEILHHRCHFKYHKGFPHKSKYRTLYGKILAELAKDFNVSPGTIVEWHETGHKNLVSILKIKD